MINKEYAYIYNPEQVKFYINECKLNIEDFGTGNKGDAFIKVKKDDKYELAFSKWRSLEK